MWSGTSAISPPNWGGNSNAGGGGGSDVGNLYTLPNPATIEENPVIGLEGRNEIPLPTKYKDFAVKNLTAENINGTPADITKWSEYPAIHNVVANTDTFGNKQYDISGFKDITCMNVIAEKSGTPASGGDITAEGNVSAGLIVEAPIGNLGTTNTSTLNVNGGSTLDGGMTHGTTIGSLPVAGVNTIRLDVLPVGIDMISATYITIDATATANVSSAGATSIAGGGALSLAGGDYIEYNSDQHKFINTSAGNDYTDIYVGNIHPADGGSQALRINGGGTGRGVEIDNGVFINSDNVNPNKLNIQQYETYPAYATGQPYYVGNKVLYNDNVYVANYPNFNVNPTDETFPNWFSGDFYEANQYVLWAVDDVIYTYRCLIGNSSTTPPNEDPTNWELVNITAPQVWSLVSSQLYNSVVFPAVGSETTYTTIAKPIGENISVIVRNTGSDTEVERGAIYTELNPPPFNPEATGDLNMNYHDINNVNVLQGYTLESDFVETQVVDIPQAPVVPFWNSTTTYAVFDKVNYLTRTYTALRLNLNLQPNAPIPSFGSGIAYLVNQIVTIGGGYNYRCILAYTSGTATPNTDPTHWTAEPDGTIAIYWRNDGEIINQGITFTKISGDTSYFNFQKFQEQDGIYIVERDATTNQIISSGRIYDTNIYPPPPFDPSITTDLDLNGHNINNVGTLETQYLASSVGGSIVLNADLFGNQRTMFDMNLVEIKGDTGADGTLQFKNTAGDITAQIVAQESGAGLSIAGTGTLTITQQGGVNIPTYNTTIDKAVVGTLGGKSGNPIVLGTGINADGNSITGLNELGANNLRTADGTGSITLLSPINANSYNITGAGTIQTNTLDANTGGTLNITNVRNLAMTGSTIGGNQAKIQITDTASSTTATIEYNGTNGVNVNTAFSSDAGLFGASVNAPLGTIDTIEPYSNDVVLIKPVLDIQTTNSGTLSAMNIRTRAGDIAGTFSCVDDASQDINALAYGVMNVAGQNGLNLQAAGGNMVVQVVSGNMTTEVDGDITSTATGTNSIIGQSVVIDSSSDVSFNTLIKANENIQIQGTTTQPPVVGFLDTTTTNYGTLSYAGDNFKLDSSKNVEIRAGDGGITFNSVNPILFNQDIQLYNSRWSIPDSSDFAWFRRLATYFSYSNDAGANWTPVAADWYNFQPQIDVDFGTKSITNLASITMNPYGSISNLETISSTSGKVDFSNGGIKNVATIEGVSAVIDFQSNNLTNVGSITGAGGTLSMGSSALTNVASINGFSTFYPVRILKQIDTTGVNLAANTAEVQINQQTMTLKAQTQYQLNIGYSGLVQNSGTATPNNTWYFIVRVHLGTSPLTTANMYGVAQLFNSTSLGNGITSTFMSASAGTYTIRWYVRNQQGAGGVSLTIPNMSASVIEIQ